MSEQLLDNPIWHSLVGPQQALAVRNGRAARYVEGVSILAALETPTPEALTDMEALVAPEDVVLLSGVDALPDLGRSWRLGDPMTLVQMVCETTLAASKVEVVSLGAADANEVMILVEKTQPGPFLPGTLRMGRYLGVREGGRLVAMAGERMKPTGFTEVSAVCTDPSQRGRGLGEALVRKIAVPIQAAGCMLFLHVVEQNERAIALYERMGFRERRRTRIAPVVRCS
jgi:predicted GNAT family acetyltransferase